MVNIKKVYCIFFIIIEKKRFSVRVMIRLRYSFSLDCPHLDIDIFRYIHPKMKKLSSFTHPHVLPNLYEFLSYVEHKRRYFEECW